MDFMMAARSDGWIVIGIIVFIIIVFSTIVPRVVGCYTEVSATVFDNFDTVLELLEVCLAGMSSYPGLTPVNSTMARLATVESN